MEDLLDLMKLYARRGIDDWKNASMPIRRRASHCLGNRIAAQYADATRTIDLIVKTPGDVRCMFIPMPNVNHDGVERCFFLPIRERERDGGLRAAFDLFLLVDDKNCLGFRFEPADPPDWTHGYSHVQMSRSMFKKSMQAAGIPQWLPDSYPAFPILTSDPLQMFLSMATAVHGYQGGLTQVLQDVFQKANRSREVAKYVEVLTNMLN